MTIVDKIRDSVHAATGLQLHYQSAEMLNTLLDSVTYPAAYLYLLRSTQIDTNGAHFRERPQIAVFFVQPTEFDFNSLENERLIDECKQLAYQWLRSLYRSKELRVVSVNGGERVYDEMDVILTGFAINLTIEELVGDYECIEIPNGTLYVYIAEGVTAPTKVRNHAGVREWLKVNK